VGLLGKFVEKRTLRRHMRTWEGNIEMDLPINKIWACIGLIWFMWWAAVNAVCTSLYNQFATFPD
jgi:hypothetical protein